MDSLLGKLSTYGRCIRKNWKWISVSLFLSQCFIWLAIPYLLSKFLIRAGLNLRYSSIFNLLVAFACLSLFLAYKTASKFWNRYNNTFRLQEIRFTYIDSIFFFVFFSVMSIIIFKDQVLGDITLSSEVSLWLIIWFMVFVIWCGVIIIRGRSFKIYPLLPRRDKSSLDYFPDEPITHEDEDQMDRKQFIEGLYNQITKYPLSDSFVFGLYGSWGEGKTSALYLLKNKLYENPSVIVFEYDPWYFSSPDKLIEGFYQGLYSSLNKIYFLPNIKKTIGKYQRLLTSGLKLYGLNIELDWGNEILEELRKKIEDWILITGKKVIILMDDIDRLQGKNEILEIFKLVKLSGKFKNTIFVLSFDPNIIISYLKEEIFTDPAFLDKIIQAPIHLPAIDQDSIDRFLLYSEPEQSHYSGIDRLFQKQEIDQERVHAFDKEFPFLYKREIQKLFPTLRQAKRYLNALNSTLPSVKNEVDLQDFLILEIIRVFFPDLYDDIWMHFWYYLPSWNDWVLLASPFGARSKEEEMHKEIKSHVEEILKPLKEKAILLNLLQTLFQYL